MSSEREAWLKGLKVGDEVSVVNYRCFREVAKIERITPTGRFILRGRTFNPDGYERGGRFTNYSIVPVTDEHRTIKEQYMIAEQMSRNNWHLVTIGKLREIDAILKRDDSGKAEETGGAEQ